MTPASAERLARRLHKYELDEAGAPYVEHLARVARLVAEAGGGPRELMAAWLHGVARTGTPPRDLAVHGVPPAVIQIIEAVTPKWPWDDYAQHATRIKSCPGATLVLQAIVTDRYRPGAKASHATAQRDAYLLPQLGLPVPVRLARPAPQAPVGPRPVTADVATLLGQFTPDNPDRRQVGLDLARSGTAEAIRALMNAYLAASAGDERWMLGGQGLGGTGYLAQLLTGTTWLYKLADSPGRMQTFLEMAAHEDAFLRSCGIRGLSGHPEQLPVVERALADDSPVVVMSALEALPGDKIPFVSDRLAAIARRQGKAWDRPAVAAARHLAAAGDPRAREAILTALAMRGRGIGWTLAKVLLDADDPAIIPVLISHLKENAPGCDGSAFILGEKRAAEAVPALGAALEREMPGGTYVSPRFVACIEALAKIGDPAAVPFLADACRHQAAGARVLALRGLKHFDGPHVAEIALQASGDLDPSVREQAIHLLAAHGDAHAVPRLLLACDGPLAPVALRGLIRLADERAVPTLVRVLTTATDREVLHLAGRAIVASARKPPSIYPWFGTPLPTLRAYIWVRGELGTTDKFDRLADYLTHRDELVRARTAAALGKIGDVSCAGKLAAALADISPRVRASAATALGKVASGSSAGNRAQAQEWLEPLLGDPHPSVRMATAAALRRLTADGDPWPHISSVI